MKSWLKLAILIQVVLECSCIQGEPRAFKAAMPAGRLALYITLAVCGTAILVLALSCICWKCNLCCTRPCGVGRVCWMRGVGLLSVCSIVFTILSCFGMSTIPSELASLGWISSPTMVGGIYAFAKINATIPPTIVKEYTNDSIVYRAGFHAVDLFSERGVMTTWGRCATALSESREEHDADGDDSIRRLLRGSRRVEEVDDDDDDDLTPTYELPEDLQEELDKKKVVTEEPTSQPVSTPTIRPTPKTTTFNPTLQPNPSPTLSASQPISKPPHKPSVPVHKPRPPNDPSQEIPSPTPSAIITTKRHSPQYHATRVGGGVYEAQFFTGCKRCRDLSPYVATMQILSVAFIIPMLALNYARSETFADGKCVKVFSVAIPFWGCLCQLGSLFLFDFGCTVWLLAEGVTRGGGYWCAYISAMIRFLIAVMNAVLAYPTEREVERVEAREEKPFENKHAYKPMSKGGTMTHRLDDPRVESEYYAHDESKFYDVNIEEEEEEDRGDYFDQEERTRHSTDQTRRQYKRPNPVRKNSPGRKGAARVSRSNTGREDPADDDSIDLGYLKDSNISDDNFFKFADQIGEDSDVSLSTSSQRLDSGHRRVRVDILSASNLENADMFGKSDPYVRCEWEDKKVYTTRVIQNSCDPEWIGEGFVLSIGPAQAKNVLLFECYDSDIGFNTKGDFLGRCELTGAELLEYGLRGAQVDLPLGPNKAHNRALRLRITVIDKVEYSELVHEVVAEPVEAEEESHGASTTSKLFSMFSSKKKKKKEQKKTAGPARSSNSAESVLQPSEDRKDNLRQAERSRGGRSVSTPRQEHQKEEADEADEFEDGYDEDSSLAGVGGVEEEAALSAWTKVLDYLHEDGDSQVTVAQRIIAVWRQAEGRQKVKRTQVVVKMDIRDRMGLELGHESLRVTSVTPGGQGEKKRVQPGWICRKVDFVYVASMAELMTALAHQKTLGNSQVDMTFEAEAFITKKETDNEWRFAGLENRGVGKTANNNVVDMLSLVDAFANALSTSEAPFTEKEERAWSNDLSNNQEWLTISLAEFTTATNAAEEVS